MFFSDIRNQDKTKWTTSEGKPSIIAGAEEQTNGHECEDGISGLSIVEQSKETMKVLVTAVLLMVG